MKLDYIKRFPLGQKIIITSIFCMLVPTIIMLYNTSAFSQKIIREQALDQANQSLRIVQNQLYNLIEEMIQVTNQVQFTTTLQSLLHQEDSPMVMQAITLQLEQIASVRPDIHITLLMKDGRSFTNYSFYDADPNEFRKQPWFDQLQDLQPYETLFLGVQPNYIKPHMDTDPYVIMTGRALTDYSSKSFAYLIVSRKENTFSSFMEQLSEEVYMLDQEDQIMVQTNDAMIGQPFQQLLESPVVENPGIVNINGQNQIFVNMPLKFSDWTIVSLVPYEQFTNRLGSIYKSGIMLQIIFVFVFLIILTYLLRVFTKPITVLSQAATKVEAGDLTIRSHVRSGDEIGRLGRAFDNMLDKISEMIMQVKLEQALKRRAELAMLQVQINPHFLFNVLNSIRLKLLLKEDSEEAALVGSLSQLLRSTLSNQKEFVSLDTEASITKQYMELMGFALRYKVTSQLDIKQELEHVIVPRFILQPIVENCYKHGFIRRGGEIQIRAELFGECLRLDIIDNGVGMDSNKLHALNEKLRYSKLQVMSEIEKETASGIGLINVFYRLKMIYGDQFQMKLASIADKGTTVTIIIPMTRMEELHHV